jgi:hypothetical protein
VQKVVLIGSSNLKNSTPFFKDPAFVFLDNSLPGWMPTPENIAAVQNTVRAQVAQQANAFVFDLLGNSSVRFEQFDGSTSLPFKSQGRFHLGSKVVVSPPDTFKKTISAIVPILLEKKDIPCVIVPPTPRYLCDYGTYNCKSICLNAKREESDILMRASMPFQRAHKPFENS